MQLSELQATFKNHLLAESQNAPEALLSVFKNSGIPLADRLEVYANHIGISLSDVITSTYTFVRALAGEAFVEQAAKAYIKQNPPREACLDKYGDTFAEFLEQSGRIDQFPFIGDAARLDWLLHISRTAKNDNKLTPEALAALAPEQYADTCFMLSDSVKLLESKYPLAALYRYTREVEKQANNDALIGETTVTPELPSLDNTPSSLLIFRVQWEPQIFEVSPSEFRMFSLLRQKETLGSALEIVLGQDPTFNFETFLSNYLALGVFTQFET